MLKKIEDYLNHISNLYKGIESIRKEWFTGIVIDGEPAMKIINNFISNWISFNAFYANYDPFTDNCSTRRGQKITERGQIKSCAMDIFRAIPNVNNVFIFKEKEIAKLSEYPILEGINKPDDEENTLKAISKIIEDNHEQPPIIKKDIILKYKPFFNAINISTFPEYIQLGPEEANEKGKTQEKNEYYYPIYNYKNLNIDLTKISNEDKKTNAERERFVSLLFVIYQIRCNLFHGEKSPTDDRDSQLVASANKILYYILNCIDKYIKDNCHK